jgi:arylsulfatase A-like enzyme
VTSRGEDDSDYITDVETARALEFIQKPRNGSDAPFFLWLAYTAPHMPATPARRDIGAQADKHAPRTASFNEQDVSDKPTWFRSQPLLSDDDIADVDDTYRRRLESMMAVDDGLERIVNALAGIGELENTYLVVTSDNGFLQGQHRFVQGKAAAYEESIRVPLLARGPGVKAGTRVTQMAANIDLPATFAEIAGVTAPDVDGRSLVPLLSGGSLAWRNDLLLEYEASTEGLPSWTAVRGTDFIFIDYPAVAEREYYDLAKDPDQLDNSYRSLERDRVDTLTKRLDQLLSCRAASCRQ